MPDQVQDVRWPGVAGVQSLRGTLSHGISPSTFVLTTYPQTARPFLFGDLIFSDGQRRVILKNCKVDRITGTMGPEGQTWTLEILDRRWRWLHLGGIDGRYNELDSNGKLVPWTIRSLKELAVLCLEAMGERGYILDLPAGLPQSAGKSLDRYLIAGENFRQTLANPPVVWDKTPPAEALARLVESYGRRVVYQVSQNRVAVVPLGVGAKLPDGPCEVITPSIDAPELPSAVSVAGAPVRFQVRFPLEAVGREWHGQYLPINDLSYAPQVAGKTHQIKITVSQTDDGTATGDPDLRLTIAVPSRSGAAAINAVLFSDSSPLPSPVFRLADQINSHPELSQVMTAEVGGAPPVSTITLTGSIVGLPFSAAILTNQLWPNFSRSEVIRAARPNGGSWDFCPPPMFSGITATDGRVGVRPTARLSQSEAISLAQQTVWKCYRIKNVDPGDVNKRKPLTIPWYGPLVRRQQVVLLETKVEQVQPSAPDFSGIQRGQTARVLPEFYSGLSRDAAARVYGSVFVGIGSILWLGSVNKNTPLNSRVEVGFHFEPQEQMIVFDDFVYSVFGDAILEPDLVLECGCLIRDDDTNQLVRWTRSVPLGGDAPPEWRIQDDLGVGVIGTYGLGGGLEGFTLLDFPDAEKRAAHYLDGMMRKYRLVGAETRQYVGIYSPDLDGAVQQVTWVLGESGATTIASRNSEHSAAIPTYPVRRRAENLPPNQAAALANIFDPLPIRGANFGKFIPRINRVMP